MTTLVDTGNMTLLPAGTQELLKHLNTLIWGCLLYADVEGAPGMIDAAEMADDEWLRGMAELHIWLQSDPRALEVLKQHGVDMMARDLLQWAGLKIPEKMQERYRLGVAARLATEKVYGDLLKRIQLVGIPVVVQKGFWLAANVYPVPTWRQYADMDLLIDDKFLFQFDALMRDEGFSPLYSALPGRQELPKWANRQVIDCVEYKKDVYTVDVHLNLVPHVLPNKCDMRAVWESTIPEALITQRRSRSLDETIADEEPTERMTTVQILHPYDTLIHLLLHTNQHCMDTGFRGLLDVLLARRYFVEGGGWHGKWDWREFVKRSRRFGVDYLVAGPLLVMRILMLPEELLVPGDLPRKLDRHGHILSRHRHLAFVEQFIVEPATLALHARDFFSPLMGAGARVWCKALWHYFFPSLKRMAARYNMEPNDTRLFLYYLLRPFSLLGRYMPSVLRRLLSAI